MNRLSVLCMVTGLVFFGCARQDQAEQRSTPESRQEVSAEKNSTFVGPTAEQIKAIEDQIAGGPPVSPNFRSKPWVVDNRCQKYVTEFKWTKEAPTLESSISSVSGDYKVSYTHKHVLDYMIEFEKAGKVAIELTGHRFTVFHIDGDTLYFADFNCYKNGCRIASYSLLDGKKLWETDLHGLIAVTHSLYSNRVSLELEDEILVVWGRERGGDYVECLDASSGRILAHHIFRHYAPGQLEYWMNRMDYRKDKDKIVKKSLFTKRKLAQEKKGGE